MSQLEIFVPICCWSLQPRVYVYVGERGRDSNRLGEPLSLQTNQTPFSRRPLLCGDALAESRLVFSEETDRVLPVGHTPAGADPATSLTTRVPPPPPRHAGKQRAKHRPPSHSVSEAIFTAREALMPAIGKAHISAHRLYAHRPVRLHSPRPNHQFHPLPHPDLSRFVSPPRPPRPLVWSGAKAGMH